MQFKSDMRAKLVELKSEFADSDMLIDFVVVMLENNKDQAYVLQQLMDLTNQNEANLISEWLFQWLEQSKTQKSQNRAFQMALTGIAADHKSNGIPENSDIHSSASKRRDLRDRLGGKGSTTASQHWADESGGGDLRNLLTRGGPQRKERKTERSSPYNAGRPQRKVNISKCTFYPNCIRVDCQYFHPTEPCLDGANCIKGTACLYTHPLATTPQECKFRENCTNPNCPYSHPSPAALALAKAAVMAKIPCRYYPECLNQQCPFLHDPSQVVLNQQQPAVITAAANPEAPSAASTTICRFDPFCTRFNCYYLHPSKDGTLINQHTSKHKVYVNPEMSKTSDRAFAADVVIERISTTMEVDP